MRPTIIVLISYFLASCGTYQGNELWKRNSCERLVDADERDRCLEDAMRKVIAAEPLRRRMRKAGHVPLARTSYAGWLRAMMDEGVITRDEADCLDSAKTAVDKVIAVDDFDELAMAIMP